MLEYAYDRGSGPTSKTDEDSKVISEQEKPEMLLEGNEHESITLMKRTSASRQRGMSGSKSRTGPANYKVRDYKPKHK